MSFPFPSSFNQINVPGKNFGEEYHTFQLSVHGLRTTYSFFFCSADTFLIRVSYDVRINSSKKSYFPCTSIIVTTPEKKNCVSPYLRSILAGGGTAALRGRPRKERGDLTQKPAEATTQKTINQGRREGRKWSVVVFPFRPPRGSSSSSIDVGGSILWYLVFHKVLKKEFSDVSETHGYFSISNLGGSTQLLNKTFLPVLSHQVCRKCSPRLQVLCFPAQESCYLRHRA